MAQKGNGCINSKSEFFGLVKRLYEYRWYFSIYHHCWTLASIKLLHWVLSWAVQILCLPILLISFLHLVGGISLRLPSLNLHFIILMIHLWSYIYISFNPCQYIFDDILAGISTKILRIFQSSNGQYNNNNNLLILLDICLYV